MEDAEGGCGDDDDGDETGDSITSQWSPEKPRGHRHLLTSRHRPPLMQGITHLPEGPAKFIGKNTRNEEKFHIFHIDIKEFSPGGVNLQAILSYLILPVL